MHRILVFNPYFRVTIDECLEHPFFSKLRRADKEMTASESIQFDWEKEHLDKDKLRQHFLEEIMYFKNVRDQ